MLRPRVIPCLLLRDGSLVKTVKFRDFSYIGDPANTCRIFNELEVDELCLLDIGATKARTAPDFELLAQLADECFMPLSYGGGIGTVETAGRLLRLGFEKVVINSSAFSSPELITNLSTTFGSQSVIVAIDVRTRWGRATCWARSAKLDTGKDPVEWAQEVERLGAGEILLTSVDREGTWAGLDLQLTRSVAAAVTIPVIAHGGARDIRDVDGAITHAGASAVAVGSMVVYQKPGNGVLVNFPVSQAAF